MLTTPEKSAINSILQKEGYTVELNKKIDGSTETINILATKKGYNLPRLKFLPYVDYLFFHVINLSDSSEMVLKNIHDIERAYVHSLFKTPRVIRLKIPNIVSVFISSKEFSPEQISYVQKKTLWDDKRGGEKHSVHLIDIKNKKRYSQDTERVSVVGRGTYTFMKADPTNRVKTLIHELAQQLWGIL